MRHSECFAVLVGIHGPKERQKNFSGSDLILTWPFSWLPFSDFSTRWLLSAAPYFLGLFLVNWIQADRLHLSWYRTLSLPAESVPGSRLRIPQSAKPSTFLVVDSCGEWYFGFLSHDGRLHEKLKHSCISNSVIATSFAFIPTAVTSINTQIEAGKSFDEAYGSLLGVFMVGAVFQSGFSFIPGPILRKIFPPWLAGLGVFLIGVSLVGVGVEQWGGGCSPNTVCNVGQSNLLYVSTIQYCRYYLETSVITSLTVVSPFIGFFGISWSWISRNVYDCLS